MRESFPYRRDLLAYAASFRSRQKSQRWGDSSLAKAEKMLFVGFLFVRKLIECQKVSDACARGSTKISRGRVLRSYQVSSFSRDDLIDDLNGISWNTSIIDVRQLCDKVIHTWWILPTQRRSGLAGFIITTDRLRNSELWHIPTPSIVKVFELFGHSHVRRISAERDDSGRLTYWQAT
jgi:hypothetical protein